MTIEAPHIPKIKYIIYLNFRNAVDTSNFSQFPDSDTEIQPLKAGRDPFLNW